MPTWNAGQYLRFDSERTRPCRDLVASIELASVKRIVDLGCGPGNSTAVLAERFPDADICGLDSSPEMIRTARQNMPTQSFEVLDIAQWEPKAPHDLVFSNAALHWVDDHERIIPRLFAAVASGGAFAAQMPCNISAPAHEAMRRTAARPEFRYFFTADVRQWHVHEAEFYDDVLAPLAARVDIWKTEYFHILPNAAAIVEWYKGTGLRPFLDRLPDDTLRDRFLDAYLEAITEAYPARRDGRVLLPFQRLFVVAYR
ncbi:MAG: trans-aconitate 2-methyltransferase [Polyangiaceae bacterium]|nr:trans-aconitate 2-methyltransferase [Polyangiaceae bacterium]